MLKNLVKFVIDPFNIFWLLLLATLGAWFFRKKRLGRWMAVFTGVWFLLISTPFVPNMVLNSLEDRYKPIFPTKDFPNREAPYHIIIMGGGHGYDDRLPANSLLSLSPLGRLVEGIRLHRQLPNSKMVLSGYSPHGLTQAEMLEQTALSLGVDKKSIILQKKPVNTFEEANTYADTYGNTHPVILVTSAAHMPRAVTAFKLFDIEVIPSPANYRLKGIWKQKWIGLPTLQNMDNISMGIEEYVGILWYNYGIKAVSKGHDE